MFPSSFLRSTDSFLPRVDSRGCVPRREARAREEELDESLRRRKKKKENLDFFLALFLLLSLSLILCRSSSLSSAASLSPVQERDTTTRQTRADERQCERERTRLTAQFAETKREPQKIDARLASWQSSAAACSLSSRLKRKPPIEKKKTKKGKKKKTQRPRFLLPYLFPPQSALGATLPEVVATPPRMLARWAKGRKTRGLSLFGGGRRELEKERIFLFFFFFRRNERE